VAGARAFGNLMQHQSEKSRIQKVLARQLLSLLSLNVSRALNRCSENVIVESIIVPELKFRNVKMQRVGRIEAEGVIRRFVDDRVAGYAYG
jgi:hypothetical protein